MNQTQFTDRLQELFNANVELARKKNADYAGDDDPFKNFRIAAAFGIPVETALIVRMSDKLARINSLLQPGRVSQVPDETVLDTLSDLANYAMILRVWLEQKI